MVASALPRDGHVTLGGEYRTTMVSIISRSTTGYNCSGYHLLLPAKASSIGSSSDQVRVDVLDRILHAVLLSTAREHNVSGLPRRPFLSTSLTARIFSPTFNALSLITTSVVALVKAEAISSTLVLPTFNPTPSFVTLPAQKN
jgi:hypothetical protein